MRAIMPDDGEETESDDGARRTRLESSDSASDASRSKSSRTGDSDSDSDNNIDSDSSLDERSVAGDNELDDAAVSDEDADELKVELSDSEEDDIHWEQQKVEENADASDSEQEEELEEVGDAIKQDVFQDDAEPKREERPEGAMQSLLPANSFVPESEGEDLQYEAGERPTTLERQEAKWLVRSVMSHVSTVETVAIRRGLQPSGPPIQAPVSHVDEFARKFRWPQHLRNLRNVEFSQDPSELLEDYEVAHEPPRQQDRELDGEYAAEESPLASVPRPILAAAAESARRSSRKRKRATGTEHHDEPREYARSAPALLNVARIGGRFGDQFVESLLAANGRALQGLDESRKYNQRCWTPLPVTRKPIANWRFVLEHLRKGVDNPETPGDVLCPPMKQATLVRIQDRLKQLYGLAWQHGGDDFFKPASPRNVHTATKPRGNDQELQADQNGEVALQL